MITAQINGAPATAEDLAPLAFAGYAHYTSMQVRERAVRGLDLHMERLRRGSVELFGAAGDPSLLCGYLRQAVDAGPADVSVTMTLFSSDIAATRGGAAAPPDVLVRTSAPVYVGHAPLRVQTVAYERFLPQVKNVATLGLTYFPRRAAGDGFDDVLFVDRQGHVSEGSIWNLALWDGQEVVWPDAARLDGVTMQLVQQGLHRQGMTSRTQPVGVGDLGDFRAAALMNSWTAGVPVRAIDDVAFPAEAAFLAALHGAYESQPLEPL